VTYEPLHHKYRPQTFADLVGQMAIATTLTNALDQERIAPAYLFTGPRGTGKTSSARILAKSLNCLQSPKPTPQPCGVCEVCRAIASGSALDVIEIDAASNTGVDNIRELIEKAQFAPVQCRYKVYVVDECLVGESLILTDQGLIRIDDPSLVNRKVLSYNEARAAWEWKQVARWLDQGQKPILEIETSHFKIKCTENHLIRTDLGWIPAKNVNAGMKILSPVPAAHSSSNMEFGSLGSVLKPLAAPQPPPREACPSRTYSGGRKLIVTERTGVSKHSLFPKWDTSLEQVKSVRRAGVESVYDIEVADNHNFVANGLLVHNCHMLSTSAFNALLKTLEEPPDRVIFILATTDPQRVLPTIISRCQRFDFRRIPLPDMVQHLGTIARQEAIDISPDALNLVGQIAQGGLRDAESLLDQLSLLSGQITIERVWDLAGAVPEQDLLMLVQAIATNSPEAVLDQARHLMERGREPLIVLQNLASFYRDLLIAKTAPNRNDLAALTPATWQQLCTFVEAIEIWTILAGQQHLRTCELQVKNTTQPRLWLEVALMGLLPGSLAATAPAIAPKPAALPANPVTVKPSAPPSPPPELPKSAPTQDLAEQPKQTIQAEAPVAAPPSIPETSPDPVEVADLPVVEPAPPVPEPAPEVDLASLWQNVLGRIQPFSTQSLLRQQAHLLALKGREARVGVKAAPLLKMAQERLPNIEAAFLEVLNHPVKVRLEVAASSAPVPPAQLPTSANEPPKLRSQPSSFTGSPAQTEAPAAPAPSSLAETAAPYWQEADEVTKAARSLAQFFNGVVVDPEASAADSSPTANNGQPVTSDSTAPELDEAESRDDDDLPF
jgi:DNA polymerase III subunit gamma/tau